MNKYDSYPVPAIAELLEELCPQGVRSHRLDKIFKFTGGYTPSKKDPANWDGGNIPWYRVEDIHTNGRVLADSLQHVTSRGVKGSGLFPAGSLIVSTSATIGEYALITTDFLCNQRFQVLTPRSEFADQIHDQYLLYVGAVIGDFCKSNVEIGGFNSVKMPMLKAFELPLPPLEVQEKIVDTLDMFTDYAVNLRHEIDLRRQQLEYYREQLLTFPVAE